MPPSGYNQTQSSYITDFLSSCMSELVLENEGLRAPVAALAREIEHIDRDLRETPRSAIETNILELTRAFYTEIYKRKPQDYSELQNECKLYLKQVNEGILAIHVEDAN